MNKERIIGWDVSRIVLALIVVYNHLADKLITVYNYDYCFLHNSPVGLGWGTLSVSAFLILSGAALSKTYPSFDAHNSCIVYYKKRIKSLMYPYWFVWIPCYVIKAIIKKTFFLGGIGETICSFLGIGSYFGIGIGIGVGEWFIGALILLYIIFPLVIWVYNKNKWFGSFVIALSYILNIINNPFDTPLIRSFVTCLMCFWVGIVCYKEYSNNRDIFDRIPIWVKCILPLLCVIAIMTFTIPVSSCILINICGLCVFVFFWSIGELIHHIQLQHQNIIIRLGKASYFVFLIQHNIIYVIYSLWGHISNLLLANMLMAIVGVLIYLIGCIVTYLYNRYTFYISKTK